MASRNIDFTERLIKVVKDSGMNNLEFSAKAGINYPTFMTYIGPKGLGRVPEWDQLVKLAVVAHVTTDWLLMGKSTCHDIDGKISEPARPYGETAGEPREIKDACRQAREILLSNHPVIKPALLSNLAAFHGSLEQEKSQNEKIEKREEEIKDLNRRLRQLEARDQAKQRTGTD